MNTGNGPSARRPRSRSRIWTFARIRTSNGCSRRSPPSAPRSPPQRLAELEPDAFDVVVVDEFHHAAAASYDRLLKRLRPRELLGLTATPERLDGRDVTEWFDDRIAVELRLCEAIDEGFLVPFQYYAAAAAAPALDRAPRAGRLNPAVRPRQEARTARHASLHLSRSGHICRSSGRATRLVQVAVAGGAL